MKNYKGTIDTKFWWIIPFLIGVSKSNVNNDAYVYALHITPFFEIGFNYKLKSKNKKQKILLSDELTKQLINSPETGMGYHRVDLYLKNGEVLKNKIVLNCSILTLGKSINITVGNIEKIVVLQPD